jgi:prevent-host-death family protein
MVHEVGSFEAKTRLAELLRLAEKGDEIVVLRRGHRVAVIVGSARYDELTRAPAKDWRQSMREHLASGPRMERAEFEEIMRLSKEGRS